MGEKIGESDELSFGVIANVLGFIDNPKLTKVASRAIALGILAHQSYKFYNKFLKKTPKWVSLNISEGTDFYDSIVNWMAESNLEYKGNDFDLVSKSKNELETPINTNQREITPEQFKFIPAGQCSTIVNGISVTLEKSLAKRTSENKKFGADKIVLSIKSHDPKHLNLVCAEIEKIGSKRTIRPITVIKTNRYGGWTTTKKLFKKHDVLLPDGQFEMLIKKVGDFLSKKEWYEEVNLRWNFGMLFHGISGGGKSTAIQALATHFGMDVFIPNLNDINDEELLSIVSEMPERSFLILEDIDAAFNKRAGNKRSGITFSGLLNVLDGVATPEGRVTAITTNHIEKLDPALIRPGRCDIQIEFKHANKQQILDLANKFGYNDKTANTYASKWSKEQISMAVVQNRFKELVK